MRAYAVSSGFSAALCRGLIEAISGSRAASCCSVGFPRLYAAASLKLRAGARAGLYPARFSAALCRGLIEACGRARLASARRRGFPRLYAAASLKHPLRRDGVPGPEAGFPRLYAAASLKPTGPAEAAVRITRFSAALCRGLIEASGRARPGRWRISGFPRLYAAASLKLRSVVPSGSDVHAGFPRLYAAASLKRSTAPPPTTSRRRFSAALCRGLIEARCPGTRWRSGRCGFPRLYAAASLKRRPRRASLPCRSEVFRGFMPRPH